MPKSTVIDNRLRIASASLRAARQRDDEVLLEFWSKETDRLLEAKWSLMNPKTLVSAKRD